MSQQTNKVTGIPVAYTSLQWGCSCGYVNTEEEGRLDLVDGDYVTCFKCHKECQITINTSKRDSTDFFELPIGDDFSGEEK